MDSFFGIGGPELVLILMLAGIIMGPKQIRRVARMLGYWTAQAQKYYRGFMQQLNQEIDAMEGEELRDTYREVQNLGRQVNSIGKDVRSIPRSLAAETDGTVRAADAAIAGALAEADGALETSEEIIQPPRPIEVEDDPAS
jgi:sec-independent protein translocase protein TatB